MKTVAIQYEYDHYLSAKKTVDDRALDNHVFHTMSAALSRSRSMLRVVEVGAGVGTMVTRLIERDVLSRAEYHLVDVDADLLAASRKYLMDWAFRSGCTAEVAEDGLQIMREEKCKIDVKFVHAGLEGYSASAAATEADLVIANAVLDLVDVPNVLPGLLKMAASDGYYWFSINFDGETIFSPELPGDEHFLRVYHQSMDSRVRRGSPAGDSKTGRHLFGHLERAGARVLAASSSDWVVYPQKGRYPDDEAYFLHYIVHTIDQELQKHQEIPPTELAEWVQLRHKQILRGELVYIAHQIDFFGFPHQ